MAAFHFAHLAGFDRPLTKVFIVGLPYMYVVWGLGLLAMSLGFNSLPKKKQRRESPFAGRSPGRPDDNSRNFPAAEKQKSLARELGIEFRPSISKGDLSDLITKERASER
jgi:hypothetical protein